MEHPTSRDDLGRFQTGNNGGPGRPRGSRNKLGEAFCDAVFEDFLKHGVAVIETVRSERPADYLKLVASLVPRQIDLNSDADQLLGKSASVEMLNDFLAEVQRDAERAKGVHNG
jgi:hypothetical protein